MGWTLLGTLIAVLAFAVTWLFARRSEIARTARGLEERARAREAGTDRARLQHPQIDLSRCVGCGSCVRACPEEGVLDLVHGQAAVVHGARCVGHGRCAEECPTGAITIGLGDLRDRRDVPAVTQALEATRTRGLFLAGEVTAHALIRTAIGQGTAVAEEVARRAAAARKEGYRGEPGVLDLLIVGAGPAGLACSLGAKAKGLRFETVERETLGGTVSKYPRRKLVMTQPVSLPLHGALGRSDWEKEELVELWNDLAARHALPIRTGVEFRGLDRAPDGTFLVDTSAGRFRARHVCLALGRRGTPRKLGVPGQDLPKVGYELIDARSYAGRRVLVVGGGDSAVEAALALGEQPGSRVWLSYRKAAFTRLRSRNEARLRASVAEGRVGLLLETEVRRIKEGAVHLKTREGKWGVLRNDDVFVMAGGTPPFPLLESCGVSFDPAERPAPAPIVERGSGLARALAVALLLALATLAWAVAFSGYYALDPRLRPASPLHAWLRPTGPLGLACGAGAVLGILANLAYLARRRFPRVPGSLRSWMTSHLATGIAAFLLVLVHAGMAPRNTVGGQALLALGVLVVTGAVGRYFYAFVPRAANGRELRLEEVRGEWAGLLGEGERRSPRFAARVRDEVERLASEGRWEPSFFRRLASLRRSERRLREALERLRGEAERAGVPRRDFPAIAALARRAQRTALAAAHFEDFRALLASWRFLHRWVALAMIVLAALHVGAALRYGALAGVRP